MDKNSLYVKIVTWSSKKFIFSSFVYSFIFFCKTNETNQIIKMNFLLISCPRPMLLHQDIKVCDYTCMVVHTCLNTVARDDQALMTSSVAQDIVLASIQATAQRDVEWGSVQLVSHQYTSPQFYNLGYVLFRKYLFVLHYYLLITVVTFCLLSSD